MAIPSIPRIGFKNLFILMLMTFVGGIILAELYRFTARFIGDPRLAAASANSLLTVILLMVGLKFIEKKVFDGRQLGSFLQLKSFYYYLPSLLIVSFCLFAALISTLVGGAERQAFPASLLYTVLWVPIVEEFVFRVGVTWIFKRWGGLFWASYFSVVLFSFSHSFPSLENVLSGNVGLSFPPLLLGIFCQVFYLLSGKISTAIVFHGVCNGSVIIFNWLDQRWLDWLSMFYI